jgi:hypothetical protein
MLAEPFLSECCHAYRDRHSVTTAVERIESMSGQVCGLDIVRFFPSIDQKRLRKLLWQLPHGVGCRIWTAVEPWLPEHGLPEGSAISNPLSNLYLAKVIDGRWPRQLTRYCDNLVLVVDDPQRELRRLHGRLHDLGLEWHDEEIDELHFCGHILYSRRTQGKGGA